MGQSEILLCRGDGKIYIELDIEDSFLERKLVAYSIARNNLVIPAILVSRSIVVDGRRNCIAIVFDLSIKQKLVVSVIDESGSETPIITKIIYPSLSMFYSKINGVLSSGSCEAIRRIDNYRSTQFFSISPIRFIPAAEGGWIFVAKIGGINAYDSEYEIKGLTADGGSVRALRYPLGSDTDIAEQKDCAVAFYLKERHQSLCIGVKRTSDRFFASMAVFTKHQFKRFAKKFEKRFSNAFIDKDYAIWFSSHKVQQCELKLQRETKFGNNPLFSIIVPLYQTPHDYFIEMIESVLVQSYSKWELILVNASPEDNDLRQLITIYEDKDNRIHVFNLENNYGITENTNKGVALAQGDYLCFFDHDDVLEPDLLFEYAKAINDNPEIGLLYCDEDKLFPNGILREPSFKPDFNYYLLRDNNYICHLLTVKKSLWEKAELPTKELDGAQDHSLSLQIAEMEVPIHHVAKVLYHWRVSEKSTASNSDSKPYATEAGIRAIKKHLMRCGIDGMVECAHGRAFRYKVDYSLNQDFIFDVLIINGSDSCIDDEFIKGLIQYGSMQIGKIIYASRGDLPSDPDIVSNVELANVGANSSWVQLMNAGLSRASSRYVLVIDSRYQISSPEWISDLFGILSNKDVALVTPMLCDMTGVVQNGGLSYSHGTLLSLFEGLSNRAPGYLFRALSTQEVSAISPYCFALDKEWFRKSGGFDEGLSDPTEAMADFCFRLHDIETKCVYTPEVQAFGNFIKGEASFGIPNDPFLEKWGVKVRGVDPFLNPNLSFIPERAIDFKIDILSF